MADIEHARQRMIDVQLRGRGIRDSRVLAAMNSVRRDAFLDEGLQEFAYEDSPLPIAEGQAISQPYIVALMLEAAEIKPGDVALEVGTGSGYAAAVASRLAEHVHTIERHGALAKAAERHLRDGGFANVTVHAGDGTRGLPAAAPFGVILVAAGGPDIPRALRDQLAAGGRLVIPIGPCESPQSLLKITRSVDGTFEEDNLGAVRFVPLIGRHEWDEDGSRSASTHVPGAPRGRTSVEMIADAAEPLPAFDDLAFGELFDRFGGRRIVLLGEASHGTAEFYDARAAITRRLIERHGFSIVAVEADWPDAAAVDRYVRHRTLRGASKPPFQRFPGWMWRNAQVESFTHWLRNHNGHRPEAERTGFFGLDIYNLRDSIAAVLAYLDEVDPAAAAVARERYGCLTPWQHEPSTYGRAVLTAGYRKCEQEVVRQCQDIFKKQLEYAREDRAGFLDAAQNARLIASAERYYRIMYYGGSESWNLRDTHMFETLTHLLEAHGPHAKAVVWAHNSHIGDARHTEMGKSREEINIGQLCRERFGAEAALIGFGTDTGTVAAASDWDGPMEIKRVRSSRPDSVERLCHDAAERRFLLDLRKNEVLSRRLAEPRLERFIGVIYRPDTELQSHYAEVDLARQFDAYVWIDRTNAITPLDKANKRTGVPDTYPFGL